MQVKKRESLSPDQLPRRRAAFPSSLRAISTVSKFREHGKYGAVSYRPIIKSLRCEKITPTLYARASGGKADALTVTPQRLGGDVPPFIQHRPFSIAGDLHRFWLLVRIPYRGLRCCAARARASSGPVTLIPPGSPATAPPPPAAISSAATGPTEPPRTGTPPHCPCSRPLIPSVPPPPASHPPHA